MKRTFIPPSHRPYVRGSKVLCDENDSITKKLKDTKYRRDVIVRALKGEMVPLNMDSRKLKELINIMYPNLRDE